MTAKQLLYEGEAKLRDVTDEAGLDAWYLFERASGMTRSRYFMYPDTEVSADVCEAYREMLDKRSRHIPLQQILGNREFMGMEFDVNEHVLIPRQDTEVLVERALKLLRDGQSVLDMCTGSGCIIISLAKNRQLKKAVGADISADALSVAKGNAIKHKADITFVKSNLFENIGDGEYDMIVSNPPYIETAEIERLMPEVRDYEPRIALDGGADGLDFYKRIVWDAKNFLKPEGYLVFEIGYNQKNSVCGLMKEAGYTDVEASCDLAGLPRVCLGRRS